MRIKEIVWQPIVHLIDGRVVGHEALARFFDDVKPDVAFAQAAAEGLARRLDRACVTAAFASAPLDGWLFVNLSPDTVRDGPWPKVPRALHDRVVWELPEAPGWGPEHVKPGVAVALDDVGAGYAEFIRLRNVSWRFLKLDRSLIFDVAHDSVKQAMVVDLLAHAKRSGTVVIAEGVETVADKELLANLGVTYGQGFLWGRPRALTPQEGRTAEIRGVRGR